MKLWLLLLALGVVFARNASAHEVRPAYLELRQIAPDTYDVLVESPGAG